MDKLLSGQSDPLRVKSFISEGGLQLISRCVVYAPSERISATEALSHPYLRGLY